MAKNYNLALIGFGGVNRALASIINSHNTVLEKASGFRLTIVGVSDSWLGSAFDESGLLLDSLTELSSDRGALASLPNGSKQENNAFLIKHPVVDIICEATITNSENGQPAIDYCSLALTSGKHVTTTNKGPLAFASQYLQQLAKDNGVGFEYEGTVMSGTPVIRYAKNTLKGCDILGFEGILNGTANYILGQVEQGQSFEAAIKEAQEKGYAEANPDADLHGWDVKLKVVILSNTLLGQSLVPDKVDCTGIVNLTEEQVRSATTEGKHWKLIGKAERNQHGEFMVSVAPQLLTNDHPLASIQGPTNAVMFTTDLLGDVMVAGPGAGRIETGYALLSDIIAIHAQQERKMLVTSLVENTSVQGEPA
jgi:homoserine dehydrogenase